MPDLSTYIGVEPRTGLNASGSTIARGLRVTLNASGNIVLAAIGVRGDYMTLQDIQDGQAGVIVSIQGGGKVPAVSSEAANVGDVAYSAANGQTSKTAAGAVVMGRWVQGTSGASVLGEVELFVNPAT